MANKVYEIVPGPDAVIVLRNPLKEFAVWDTPVDSTTTTTETPSAAAGPEGLAESPELIAKEETTRTSIFGDGAPGKADEIKTNGDTEAPDDTELHPNACDDGVPVGGIHYHCSAAHLKLASKTFDNALSGNWAESSRKVDGRYYVMADGWDEAALLILLNVIHMRNSEVPRELTLEELAKVATLVDYYQCHDAVAFSTEKWIFQLRTMYRTARTYGRDLVLYICIANVFKISEIFTEATAVAINSGSDGSLRTLGLPIQRAVSDTVDTKRTRLIRDLVDDIFSLLDNLQDPKYKCPQHDCHSDLCGSVLSGALGKKMRELKLSPRPAEPFSGICLSNLYHGFKAIQSVEWRTPRSCKCIIGSSSVDFDALHKCNLKNQVLEMLSKHRVSSGLGLEECRTNTRNEVALDTRPASQAVPA